jgi:Ca-activated chloride channel homolog
MIERNDPRLTAYVLGELNASEVLEVEAAIAKSSDLQKAVDEIRQSVDFLKRGLGDELGANEMSAKLLVAGVRVNEVAVAPDLKAVARNRWPWAVTATLLIALLGYSVWQVGTRDGREVAVLARFHDSLQPSSPARNENRTRNLLNGETQNDTVEVPFTESPSKLSEGLGYGIGGMGDEGRGGLGGKGAGHGGDRYEPIIENDFLRPSNQPLSTFSIDVDTASYSKVRSYLLNYNQLPPAGAVRIEELINYFPYDYAPPTDEAPFAAHQSIAICPWNPQHKLVRVALKGREIKQDKRPVSNLVFLLDVSGSMNESAKLPLLKRGIQMLINQLTENDRVAIVVYAGAAGTVLDSTTGDQKSVILGALDRLQAGGSTNGGDGIRLAYKLALDHFITGGVNRVILCTDGDFNVGTTSNDELVQLVAENAKQNIFLSVLGFGMGNLNDSMLELISNRGNGNYAFIDTDSEAKKVLVEQMSGTLITIAKDVKIQVEFNPGRVAAYRLIGYENRVLAAQDFNDDKKDAGEIGAGHCVTALYEIVPAGKKVEGLDAVDELKYQAQPKSDQPAISSNEILTLKLRYKDPEGDTSKLLTFPLADSNRPFAEADPDFQFAAAVASFGMQLRQSKWAGKTSLDAVLEMAQAASKSDEFGYRAEFLQIVRGAKELMPKVVMGY